MTSTNNVARIIANIAEGRFIFVLSFSRFWLEPPPDERNSIRVSAPRQCPRLYHQPFGRFATADGRLTRETNLDPVGSVSAARIRRVNGISLTEVSNYVTILQYQENLR